MRNISFVFCFLLLPFFASSQHVEGFFKPEKIDYMCGEPIFVRFHLKNGTDSIFRFEEGGDYRGSLRHDRYSFSIERKDGRSFTKNDHGMNLGGLGNLIELEPGEEFISCILLSSYFEILPPGNYTVSCLRKLGVESGETPDSLFLEVNEKFFIRINPYDQDTLRLKLQDIFSNSEIPEQEYKKAFFRGKPVDWAMLDLAEKMKIRYDSFAGEALLEDICAALPEEMTAEQFLAFKINAFLNENERIVLSISMKNNSNESLVNVFENSSMNINSVLVPEWPVILGKEARALNEDILPGTEKSVRLILPFYPDHDGFYNLEIYVRDFEFSIQLSMK